MPSEDIRFAVSLEDDGDRDSGGDGEGLADTRGSMSGKIVCNICGSSVSTTVLTASWNSDAVAGAENRGELGLGTNTDAGVAFSVGDVKKGVGDSSARFGDKGGVELIDAA